MKFTTPCFVRVENWLERNELNIWLKNIGYIVDRKFGSFLFAKYQTVQHGCDIEYNSAEVIDCGTNTELFKALAAMNSENDREQWFITDNDEWFVSGYDKQHRHACNRTINGVKIGVRTARKATTEEIVEYLKNK